MQLDLFKHTHMEPDQILLQFLELKESHEKLRRGIFKRYQDLLAVVTDLRIKMEEINDNKQ